MTIQSASWKALIFVTSVGAAAVALTACDEVANISEEEYIERAQEHRQAGDLRASSIELKNALQKNPDSARARLLLGQLYVDIGDGASAEKELERARNLGMDEHAITRPLGLAWLLQRKFRQVLDIIQPADGGSALGRASILTLRGRAHAGLGEYDAARADFEAALQEDPKSVDSLVGLAHLFMAQNDLAGAEEYLAKAQSEAPAARSVLTLSGDIAYLKGDYEGSEAAYRELRSVYPNSSGVLVGLSRAQIGAGKLDQAIETLDIILKSAPNHPPANYLRALAAFRQKDYQAAKIHVERVLNVATSDLRSLLLSGASGFAVGELEHAKKRLTQFLSQVPSNEHARRLLGATLLRLAEADKALDQLKPLVEETPEDVALLSMIAQAAVRSGDLKAGSEYYEQALKADPKNSALRERLGITRIALGDDEAGIQDLERALSEDPTLTRAVLNVFLSHLRGGEFEKARQTARKMQENWPKEAFGYTAEGIALMRQNKLEDAKQAFSRAVELSPGTPDASNNLSVIAERQGDLKTARSVLQESLEAYPGDPRVLNRLAELTLKDGDTAKAKVLLEQAVERSPNMVQPRATLARTLLLEDNAQGALALAREGLEYNPGASVFFDIAGQALAAQGQYDEAVNAFSDLVGSSPRSAIALVKLADTYLAKGDLENAAKYYGEGRNLQSGNSDAIIGLAVVAARQGKLDEAQGHLDALSEAARQRPEALEVEGDMALMQKNTEDALAKYYAALAERPTKPLLLKALRVHRQRGEHEEATRLVESWLVKLPDNLTLKYQLAVQKTLSGEPDSAIKTYRDIVAADPRHWQAHNNLSTLLLEKGDLENAIRHAETAEALAPDNPAVLDTLGKALIAKGDGAQALRVMNRAAQAGPQYPAIQLHLAEALAMNDKTDEARDVIDALLNRQSDFPERPEAEALKKKLTGN